MPPRRELNVPYALSGLLAVLLLLASVAGLLFGGGGFYDAYPASLAGLVGQDTVTLALGGDHRLHGARYPLPLKGGHLIGCAGGLQGGSATPPSPSRSGWC